MAIHPPVGHRPPNIVAVAGYRRPCSVRLRRFSNQVTDCGIERACSSRDSPSNCELSAPFTFICSMPLVILRSWRPLNIHPPTPILRRKLQPLVRETRRTSAIQLSQSLMEPRQRARRQERSRSKCWTRTSVIETESVTGSYTIERTRGWRFDLLLRGCLLL